MIFAFTIVNFFSCRCWLYSTSHLCETIRKTGEEGEKHGGVFECCEFGWSVTPVGPDEDPNVVFIKLPSVQAVTSFHDWNVLCCVKLFVTSVLKCFKYKDHSDYFLFICINHLIYIFIHRWHKHIRCCNQRTVCRWNCGWKNTYIYMKSLLLWQFKRDSLFLFSFIWFFSVCEFVICHFLLHHPAVEQQKP